MDDFQSFTTGKSDTFDHTFAITPNDATDLPYVTRGLKISGEGVISYVSAKGIQVNGFPVETGYHPIRVKRLLATGTTAGLTIFGGI